MKNKDKVAELIAALKAEAENEFELHRISVLEKDLLEGLPKADIIDDTHQKFNGKIYRKSHYGHFVISSNIHRDVLEYYNGSISKEYVVHHIDCNKSNNDINNLQIVTPHEHRAIHNTINGVNTFKCKICGRESNMRYKKLFVCSAECYEEYTSQNYKEGQICPVCGNEFLTPKSKKNKTCSKSCALKLRWIQSTGTLTKKCEICGQEYQATKNNSRYCSRKCSDIANKKDKRFCIICGKEFFTYKYRKTNTCSNECRGKLISKTKQSK